MTAIITMKQNKKQVLCKVILKPKPREKADALFAEININIIVQEERFIAEGTMVCALWKNAHIAIVSSTRRREQQQ